MTKSTALPDSGQSADGLYEIVSTPVDLGGLPVNGRPAPPVSREEAVATILLETRQALKKAGHDLYKAYTRGVKKEEAAASLDLSDKFLAVLANFTIDQVALELWHDIQCQESDISSQQAEVKRMRLLYESLEAGDDDTIHRMIWRA